MYVLGDYQVLDEEAFYEPGAGKGRRSQLSGSWQMSRPEL